MRSISVISVSCTECEGVDMMRYERLSLESIRCPFMHSNMSSGVEISTLNGRRSVSHHIPSRVECLKCKAESVSSRASCMVCIGVKLGVKEG